MGALVALRDPSRSITHVPLVWWIAVTASLGVLAAVGGAVASSLTSGDEAVLWLEVARAGIQVVAVGVVGGALTAVWRGIAARAETAAATKEKIRAEFAELVELYNGVKTVRRTLRSLGLDAKLHLDPTTYENEDENYFETPEGRAHLEAAARPLRLSREQAAGFHEQMQVLNTLQLEYETKYRQFEQAALLEEGGDEVEEELRGIESYLNELVDLWTKRGWTIREGTPLHAVSDPLQPLFRKRPFKEGVSVPMRAMTGRINANLFGSRPGTARREGRRVRGRRGG